MGIYTMTQITTINQNKIPPIKHGILSNAVLLPWESKEDYQQLTGSFFEDLTPVGIVQEQMVHELVEIVWRKLRLIKASNSNYHKLQYRAITNSQLNDILPVAFNRTLGNLTFPSEKKEQILGFLKLTTLEINNLIGEYQNNLELLEKVLAENLDYENTLARLPDALKSLWHEALEEVPYYRADKKSLSNFLTSKIISDYRYRLTILNERHQIKDIIDGETYAPDATAIRLLSYEQFLDRKYEKTLAMLLKLKEMQGNSHISG